MAVQIQTPPALEKELKAAMKEASIPVPDTAERWEQALKALKVSSWTRQVAAQFAEALMGADTREQLRLERVQPAVERLPHICGREALWQAH